MAGAGGVGGVVAHRGGVLGHGVGGSVLGRGVAVSCHGAAVEPVSRPAPLFTRVPRREILRSWTSDLRSSRKLDCSPFLPRQAHTCGASVGSVVVSIILYGPA